MKQFPFLLWLWALLAAACTTGQAPEQPARPNVLLIITDDQSYPHTSAYGYEATQTPGFDRIAGEGVLFTRAFAASPGCSPSRAALLTGLNCWQLGAAGTHASHFDPQYHSYPELLQQAGYFTGYTGKGWGPGNWEISGRKQNPAGPAYNLHTLESPPGISDKDYARNFEAFLSQKPPGQPFCFWMGGHEPHRQFGKGLGMQAGKSLAQAEVPAFLPDHEEIRADLLDYAFEIEWFDAHVVRVLELLEEKGELDNTLVIMTSDNGMAFPRAKANVYEYGIHVPLAIRWGAAVPGGRTLTDLVGFTDLAPTILEAAGVAPPADYPLSGSSILPLLLARQQGQLDSSRRAVYASRERHSSSRYHSLGYPQRAMRTGQYLYIRNFKPERWPAGAPQKYGQGNYPTAEEVRQQVPGPMHAAYHDIDPCPSMDFLIAHRDEPEVAPFFQLAVGKRPAEELYDVMQDPACVHNLAQEAAYQDIKAQLSQQLHAYLAETGDARVRGKGEVWETYPRYSRLRAFSPPQWVLEHPEWVPRQDWLELHWEKQLK